jgi:hypothetical protein
VVFSLSTEQCVLQVTKLPFFISWASAQPVGSVVKNAKVEAEILADHTGLKTNELSPDVIWLTQMQTQYKK